MREGVLKGRSSKLQWLLIHLSLDPQIPEELICNAEDVRNGGFAYESRPHVRAKRPSWASVTSLYDQAPLG